MLTVQTFWKFSRPHTLIGTTISIIGIYFITVNESLYFSFHSLYILFFALFPAWLGNIFITGLNQITDISIDKINKPFLPLASGDMTLFEAKLLVVLTGALGLFFSWLINIFLALTIFIGMFIGALYSLPPIRLKRIPYLSSLAIFTVRGMVVNVGIFLYFKTVLVEPLLFSPDILFLTIFVTVLSMTISLLKDIPDTTGDSFFKISTFSVKYGRKNIFVVASTILVFDYIFGIVVGLIFSQFWNMQLMIIIHGVLLILLLFQIQKVNLENNLTVTRFYMFIWDLFYLEYLLLPFLRV